MDSYIPSTIMKGRNGVLHYHQQQEQQQRLNIVLHQKLLDGQHIDKVSQLSVVSISAATPVSVKDLNSNTNKLPTTIVVGYTTHDDSGSRTAKTNNYHLAETSEQFDQPNSEDEADEREYQEYKRARKLKKQNKKDLKEQKSKEKLELKAKKRALKEEKKISHRQEGGRELSRHDFKSRGRRQSQGEIQYVKKSGIARFFKRRSSNSPRSGEYQEVYLELNGKSSIDGQGQEDLQYQTKQEQNIEELGMNLNHQKQGDNHRSQIEVSTLSSSTSPLQIMSSSDLAINPTSHSEGGEKKDGGVQGGEVALRSNEGDVHSKTNIITKGSYWSRVWSKVKGAPAQSRSKCSLL